LYEEAEFYGFAKSRRAGTCGNLSIAIGVKPAIVSRAASTGSCNTNGLGADRQTLPEDN
jgi:hypothetical protein